MGGGEDIGQHSVEGCVGASRVAESPLVGEGGAKGSAGEAMKVLRERAEAIKVVATTTR